MLSLFFCYAAEDQVFCEEMEKQLALLKRQGLLKSWSSLTILAGKNVQKEIEQMIAQAHIALLLVSADFLAIDELYNHQLMPLMARHSQGSLSVIPVLVRPVEGWKMSIFGHLKAVPYGEKPISLWKNRDVAYTNVAAEVRRVIEEIESTILVEQPTLELAKSAVPGSAEPVRVELNAEADEHSTIANVDQGSQALAGDVNLSMTASSSSRIEDIEQNIGEVDGNIKAVLKASGGSNITGIKQRVNKKGRSAK